jgi:hypothetical protein
MQWMTSPCSIQKNFESTKRRGRKKRFKNLSRGTVIFLSKLELMIRAEIRSVKSRSMRPSLQMGVAFAEGHNG